MGWNKQALGTGRSWNWYCCLLKHGLDASWKDFLLKKPAEVVGEWLGAGFFTEQNEYEYE